MDAKTLCLGVLIMNDATGYEIRQNCAEGVMSNFHHISYGSVYPTLNLLLKEGMVTCKTMSQDKKPDKKVYHITKKGVEFFTKSLIKEPEEDKHKSESLFMLFFAKHLTAQQVDVVLDNILKNISKKLEKFDSCKKTNLEAGQKFIRGLGETVNRTIAEYIKDNRDYLINELEK